MSETQATKRRFSGERLYRLLKWIVIGITVVAWVLAIYSYSEVMTGKALRDWEKTCGKYGGTYGETYYDYCMGAGFQQISDLTNAMYKEFAIGIFLPLVFFGGVGLYRYIFPTQRG